MCLLVRMHHVSISEVGPHIFITCMRVLNEHDDIQQEFQVFSTMKDVLCERKLYLTIYLKIANFINSLFTQKNYKTNNYKITKNQ